MNEQLHLSAQMAHKFIMGEYDKQNDGATSGSVATQHGSPAEVETDRAVILPIIAKDASNLYVCKTISA